MSKRAVLVVLMASVLLAVTGVGSVIAKGNALESEMAWSKSGLHRFDDLGWSEGSGTLEGFKVARVGMDEATGAQAFFLNVDGVRKMQGDGSMHYHPNVAHTVVLDGQLNSVVNGKKVTLGPGDYFRSTFSNIHADTDTMHGATLFMLSDGAFETVSAEGKAVSGMAPGQKLSLAETALHSVDSLKWEEGRGSFEGTQMAMVGTDPSSGASAMFLKVPERSLDQSHGGRVHAHTANSHVVILEGQVATYLDGERIVLGPGDYFRTAAGVMHASTEVIANATMFMVTDGSFDIVYE